MTDKKKPTLPKGFKDFKFKIYWIYGIIAILFLAINFTSLRTTDTISETEFLNKVENNEVISVIFVTNAGYAEVELNNSTKDAPILRFRYSDIKDVKEQIRSKQSNDQQIDIDSKEENTMFSDILGWILPLAFFIFIPLISYFKIYEKSNNPGWSVIIPIYNVLIYLKVIGKPWYWIFLFCIPFVNIVFHIWGCNLLSKKFGKEEGFTVGLVLLPFIFLPILGFDNSVYTD
jgi:hypothetical protein